MQIRVVTIRMRAIILCLLMLSLMPLAVASAAACSPGAPDDAEQTVTLRVFAASSVTDALADVAAAFEEENDGIRVETHFAGSSRLRAQIEEGAEADVFISADTRHIDALGDLIDPSTREIIARNRVVVIFSSTAPQCETLLCLLEPDMRIVMALPDVPAGRYSREALESLSNTKIGSSIYYRPDYADRVMENVVSLETNVRAVLAKVVIGEADAGFVYYTDTRGSNLPIKWLPLPARPKGEYESVVLEDASAPVHAADFIRYLLTDTAQGILDDYGFWVHPLEFVDEAVD